MAGRPGAARLETDAWRRSRARSPGFTAVQQCGLRACSGDRVQFLTGRRAEEELVRMRDAQTYQRLDARTLEAMRTFEVLLIFIGARRRVARVMGEPARSFRLGGIPFIGYCFGCAG